MKAKKFSQFLSEKDMIKGGVADYMTPQQLAKLHGVDIEVIHNALEVGKNHEMEHTEDETLAYEIALDHVHDDAFYYDKLLQMDEGKVKVYLDKILRKMVDGGLGNTYNPKMRAELRDKIEQVVKETMEKYDYVVESSVNEDIFRTYNEVVGYEFNNFKEAYLELHKDNEVIYDKKDDVSYGIRKGEKEPHWKYFHDDYTLHHSEKDRDVLGLIHGKKMVSKGHPWSK